MFTAAPRRGCAAPDPLCVLYAPARERVWFLYAGSDIFVAQASAAHCAAAIADGGVRVTADAIMLLLGIGFFAAAILYTCACDRM
jgi:hypothetical protein